MGVIIRTQCTCLTVKPRLDSCEKKVKEFPGLAISSSVPHPARHAVMSLLLESAPFGRTECWWHCKIPRSGKVTFTRLSSEILPGSLELPYKKLDYSGVVML